MMDYLSNGYFDVLLLGMGGMIKGQFTSVSGLGMEIEYEIYNEGGANYPRYFFKGNKPQKLVLEQGVLTDFDNAAMIMGLTAVGIDTALAGGVVLYDSFGIPQREWSIVGAHITKYEGPDLDANKPKLAVNRIELLHNGCY